jgi:hypothetical protein
MLIALVHKRLYHTIKDYEPEMFYKFPKQEQEDLLRKVSEVGLARTIDPMAVEEILASRL